MMMKLTVVCEIESDSFADWMQVLTTTLFLLLFLLLLLLLLLLPPQLRF
jgi:hypothetical protein